MFKTSLKKPNGFYQDEVIEKKFNFRIIKSRPKLRRSQERSLLHSLHYLVYVLSFTGDSRSSSVNYLFPGTTLGLLFGFRAMHFLSQLRFSTSIRIPSRPASGLRRYQPYSDMRGFAARAFQPTASLEAWLCCSSRTEHNYFWNTSTSRVNPT